MKRKLIFFIAITGMLVARENIATMDNLSFDDLVKKETKDLKDLDNNFKQSDKDCSREATGVLFAGGVNAAKFFEYNAGKCELNKKASKLLDQLDIRAGLMQTFSDDVQQFLCEEPNTEGLKELILNKFKIQDSKYYQEHQGELEAYVVNAFIETGRTKDTIACPSGVQITGTPCHWRCTKELNSTD